MSVTIDSANGGSSASSGATLSWSHTTGSLSNGALVVPLANANNAAAPAQSVTYKSIGATLYDSQATGDNSTTAELWSLVAPTAGANTVLATYSPSVAFGIGGQSISLAGVDQVTLFRGAATKGAANGSTAATISVPSAVGDLVIDCVADNVGSGLPVAGGSQTPIGRFSPGGNFDMGSSYQAGASSVTMAWTTQVGGDWAQVGGSVKAAAGGGGSIIDDDPGSGLFGIVRPAIEWIVGLWM